MYLGVRKESLPLELAQLTLFLTPLQVEQCPSLEVWVVVWEVFLVSLCAATRPVAAPCTS